MRRAAAILALLTACSAHQVGNALGAGVSTPVGVGIAVGAAVATSVASRAMGGCYAICQQGEVCNPRNGYCEALPCRGECAANEKCEEGFFRDKCTAGLGQSVSTTRETELTKTPAIRIQNLPSVPEAARPDITQP